MVFWIQLNRLIDDLPSRHIWKILSEQADQIKRLFRPAEEHRQYISPLVPDLVLVPECLGHIAGARQVALSLEEDRLTSRISTSTSDGLAAHKMRHGVRVKSTK